MYHDVFVEILPITYCIMTHQLLFIVRTLKNSHNVRILRESAKIKSMVIEPGLGTCITRPLF